MKNIRCPAPGRQQACAKDICQSENKFEATIQTVDRAFYTKIVINKMEMGNNEYLC